MANMPGTTRAQTDFLRAFVKSPFGPQPQDWPSAAVLRRWMRRPEFRDIMKSLRMTLRYHADFQLLSAAAAAAQMLQSAARSGDPETARIQVQLMSNLLKLAHQRERFAPAEMEPEYPDHNINVYEFLSRYPRDRTVGEILRIPEEMERLHQETLRRREQGLPDEP